MPPAIEACFPRGIGAIEAGKGHRQGLGNETKLAGKTPAKQAPAATPESIGVVRRCGKFPGFLNWRPKRCVG